MPTKASVIGLSTVVAVTLGCDLFGPARPLSHAAAMTWCGPADEGFTGIVLAEEPIQSAAAPFPNVAVAIPQRPSQLPGHTYSVTGNPAASASYDTLPDKSQGATGGTVTIDSVDSSNTIVGSVSLRFPSRFVQTAFTAPWISSGVYCN